MKTEVEKVKSEIAAKYGLGKTLVTGHKAMYWEEVIEVCMEQERNKAIDDVIEELFISVEDGYLERRWEYVKQDLEKLKVLRVKQS